MDCGRILLVADHRALAVLAFPWPTFQHYKQPLSIVAEFDYNAMDAVVVVLVTAELDVVLVAHTANTSLALDVVRADSAHLAVDAFPILHRKKQTKKKIVTCCCPHVD